MTISLSPLRRAADRAPPQAWFGVSAIFHYLGPSLAVLLFPTVGVLGVAWFRIATAAAVFAPIARPWRAFRHETAADRWLVLGLGVCLAAMNCCFYLALARLPLGTVAAIEFVGVIGLALWGARTARNLGALGLAVLGVILLLDVHWSGARAGLGWAVANGVLFVAYVALGHRAAERGAGAGIPRLGAAMAVAFVVVSPVGLDAASRAFAHPALVLAGAGVGVCSSVVPYVCDQLAMARLPRATFALMLTLLPASATLIGALVLSQIPSARDLVGIGLVMAGVGLHRAAGAA